MQMTRWTRGSEVVLSVVPILLRGSLGLLHEARRVQNTMFTSKHSFHVRLFNYFWSSYDGCTQTHAHGRLGTGFRLPSTITNDRLAVYHSTCHKRTHSPRCLSQSLFFERRKTSCRH
jgi:hypothetical protein